MTKQELRKKYLHLRATLTEGDRNIATGKMLTLLETLPLPQLYVLLSYRAIRQKHELDPSVFSAFLQSRFPQLRMAYPVSDLESCTIQAFAVDAETSFHLNKWGIPEPARLFPLAPAAIDMVFVPLLCFDTKGYRVGYGKGFYDKYLALCRKEVVKIGFSCFGPETAIDDTDRFDIPLDICITPETIYEFS